MKIAVPLFGAYVAPRFDSAERILLVTVEGKKLLQKEEVAVPHGPFLTRLNRILELNPDVLVCGNIDGFSGRMIAGRGIRVFSRIMGEPDEVIRLVLRGRLEKIPQIESGAVCWVSVGSGCGRRRRGRWGKVRKNK